MTISADFNPFLPDTQKVIPTNEGGKGIIHQPGEYQNIIWQTRHRIPDSFELALISALESLFADGVQELADIVSQLNAQRVLDRNGQVWTEDTFQHFLAVNGY
ncbi:MAG: recombinase-like helix-turn-helix domain-containing protein [Enterobacteriaceae bacterium]